MAPAADGLARQMLEILMSNMTMAGRGEYGVAQLSLLPAMDSERPINADELSFLRKTPLWPLQECRCPANPDTPISTVLDLAADNAYANDLSGTGWRLSWMQYLELS
jgi:hypothetical protein